MGRSSAHTARGKKINVEMNNALKIICSVIVATLLTPYSKTSLKLRHLPNSLWRKYRFVKRAH